MKHCLLSLLAAAAMLIVFAPWTRAGFSVPPQLQTASEAERQRYLQLMGERSLRDKIAVGKQRTLERQAFRRQVLAGFQANAQERRKEIRGEVVSAPIEPERKSSQTASLLWWSALTLTCGLLLLRFTRRQFRTVEVAEPRSPRPAT